MLLDSTILSESDSLYVARPGGLAIGEAGELYVVDFFQNHVVRFGVDGRAIQTYPRSGAQSGGVGSVAAPVLLLKSLVGVLDYQPRVVRFFDRQSGEYVGLRPYAGLATSVYVAGDLVWMGDIDSATGYAVSRWEPPTRLELSATRVTAAPIAPDFAPLPREYRESEVLRGVYGLVYAVPWSDTVAVGFAATNYVVRYTAAGRLVDTLFVPAVRRRGTPRDFEARVNSRRLEIAEIFSLASGLFGVSRTKEGSILLVHFDSQIEGSLISSRVFVSLVAPKRRVACVDTELPVSQVAQPVVALRADTVYLLEQRLRRAATGGVTTVKRYLVRSDSCDWLPASRASRDR